jgi:hypothetical protein
MVFTRDTAYLLHSNVPAVYLYYYFCDGRDIQAIQMQVHSGACHTEAFCHCIAA